MVELLECSSHSFCWWTLPENYESDNPHSKVQLYMDETLLELSAGVLIDVFYSF